MKDPCQCSKLSHGVRIKKSVVGCDERHHWLIGANRGHTTGFRVVSPTVKMGVPYWLSPNGIDVDAGRGLCYDQGHLA